MVEEPSDIEDVDLDEDLPPAGRGPQPEGRRASEVLIEKKEGHCIMTRDAGHPSSIWTQSAGDEMDDALEKAKRLWKPTGTQLVNATLTAMRYRFEWSA